MDSYYWLTSWVHLRDGGIVPMVFDVLNQNDPSVLHNTTDQVGQNPLDLHIHPTFKEKDEDAHTGECKAKGRFLNDDGLVLDYVGYQNRYDFDFKANCTNDGKTAPTEITLQVTQVGLADKFKPLDSNDYNITNNDYLGKIEFYNTRADYFLMNATYKAKVWWLDN